MADTDRILGLYRSWHEADGQEAWDLARIDNPRYNDGDHHTESALEDILSSFEDWLEEHGLPAMNQDEHQAIWEEIWGGLT